VIRTFASLSVPGAVLIFSCERPASPEDAPLGWRLLPTGRFAHTKQHAVDAAAAYGYQLLSYAEIIPRMEKGEPVRGHLFAFVLRNGGSSKQQQQQDYDGEL
jgi:predicted TPR repeat methyltransferase